MQVSMEDVLNLPILPRADVLTANHTLADRQIKVVSFLEAPVDIFDRDSELILTTGIGFQNDDHIFKQFVEDLIDAEAEALIISRGKYVKEVPEAIIKTAEKSEFPIITIPWEIRIGQVSQAIMAKINSNSDLLYEKSKEMQTELLRLFLQDTKLSDALNVIFKYIHMPMAIIDMDGEIKVKSINTEELTNQWNGFMHSLSAPFTSRMIQKHSDLSQIDSKWYRLKEFPILLIPIHPYKGSFQGYLLIYLGGNSSKSYKNSDVKQLLDYTVTSLALWFQREYSILETEMRLRADFVLTLAKGLVDSWDLANQQAKMMKYNLELPYVCLIGLPKNIDDLIEQQNINQDKSGDLKQKIILSVEKQIHYGSEVYRKKTLFTYYQDRFIIYLEPTENDIKKGIDTFLDFVENKLQKLLPGIEIAWGMDDKPRVKEFQKGFNRAQVALNTGLQQADGRQRFTIANVGLYKVLLSLEDNPEAKDLISSTLGKLIEHDEQKNAELVKTLSLYVQNLGNISQTSRELYIHRQSLLYRIQQIESITGLSLRHPDDFLAFHLSLKFWGMGMGNSKKESP